MKTSLFGLIITAGFFFLSSCSSIEKKAMSFYLGKNRIQRAKGIRPNSPPLPYQRQDDESLDRLWHNQEKGSFISYFSHCGKGEQDLKSFQKNAFPQNLNYKKIDEKKLSGSLYTILEVSSPKGKTYIGIYTAKKKSCYFNIELIAGSYSLFKEEEPLFKKFIEGFNF